MLNYNKHILTQIKTKNSYNLDMTKPINTTWHD